MDAISNEVLETWGRETPYVHLTIKHAQEAAGYSPSAALEQVRRQATLQAKSRLQSRMVKSVYAGITPAGVQTFTNSITNLEKALSNTQQTVDYLKNMLANAVDIAAENNETLSAHDIGAKISTLIYHAGPQTGAKKEQITTEIQEIFNLIYGTDVAGLIAQLNQLVKTKQATPIQQSQLASLQKLQDLMKNNKVKGIDARNLLVEILTEQGLPDFLTKCAQQTKGVIDNLVESAQHLGKERVQSVGGSGRSVQGKIDTMITFNIPTPGTNSIQKITQGISLKSNFKGYAASILSTNIRTSLVYVDQYDYSTLNALSLMDADTLKRWILFSNLDRALQGTMQELQGGIANTQDRADILIEFTQNGVEVFSITEILTRFLTRLQQVNDDKMLSKYGFQMANYKDNKVVSYNTIRDQYKHNRGNVLEHVRSRSQSTSKWLSTNHSIQLDANVMMRMLNNK